MPAHQDDLGGVVEDDSLHTEKSSHKNSLFEFPLLAPQVG